MFEVLVAVVVATAAAVAGLMRLFLFVVVGFAENNSSMSLSAYSGLSVPSLSIVLSAAALDVWSLPWV